MLTVVGNENTSVSVSSRLGKLESVERNESKSIGLELIDNKRKVTLSSTNFNQSCPHGTCRNRHVYDKIYTRR